MVAWMVEEKGIDPHVPAWEMGERSDGTFSRSQFAFDGASNTLTCPAGKRLQQYRSPRNFERSGVHERLATPTRFERATYRLGICRSILLSYGVPMQNQYLARRICNRSSACSIRRALDRAGGPNIGVEVVGRCVSEALRHGHGLAILQCTEHAATFHFCGGPRPVDEPLEIHSRSTPVA